MRRKKGDKDKDVVNSEKRLFVSPVPIRTGACGVYEDFHLFQKKVRLD